MKTTKQRPVRPLLFLGTVLLTSSLIIAWALDAPTGDAARLQRSFEPILESIRESSWAIVAIAFSLALARSWKSWRRRRGTSPAPPAATEPVSTRGSPL